MIDRRIPTHLAVLVGVSAGAYAISLAGVTALQSNADVRLITQRAPVQGAAEAAAADHDALEDAVAAAARRYAALAATYDRIGADLGGMEGALDDLATRAADLTESAASLPTRFSLPRVQAAPRRVASPPKTHATTGASG